MRGLCTPERAIDAELRASSPARRHSSSEQSGVSVSESHAGHLAHTGGQDCIDGHQDSALPTIRAVKFPG